MPLLLAFLPLVVLIALLAVTIRIFGSDALSGGSQICLLLSAATCVILGRWVNHKKWVDFENAIAHNISGVTSALIILLLIGALSGAWMVSGVVPTLICYGVQIIHPSFFLVSCCVICALVSVMTGSSWTTIATIGIALMGIGRAQGFDDGWVAGAIISGAYFGDKISPLSDTTILAASVTDTPLFRHIRYLLYTTIPSLVVALTVFAIKGATHDAAALGEMQTFTSALENTFVISPWLLIVPIFTAILIARRVSSIITLFSSAILAALAALLVQPNLISSIAAVGGVEGLSDVEIGFKGVYTTLFGSTSLSTGHPDTDALVATRGMSGMMDTLWLIICAMCFGGAMTAGGMLESITRFFVRFARGRLSMVGSTVGAGLLVNIATADQYISIILTGRMFKEPFRAAGYESRLLSRTTEDAVTVTSPLIPWNTCGLTQSTVLGVATLTYLPYCIFNLVSPLMSILIAATGWRIYRVGRKSGTPIDPHNPALTGDAAAAVLPPREG